MTKSSTEPDPRIEVLFNDEDLVAVNKPSGLPTQPDKTGDRSLLEMLCAQMSEPGIGLIHRLDRPVSGIVLFARTPVVLAAMNALLRERKVEKHYWAIVEGSVKDKGLLEHDLVHDHKAMRSKVSGGMARPEGPNRLRYRPLADGDRYTLLEIVPEGGAFHQIRAQLAAFGHPIKGDVKYGARRGEKDRSIGLHARRMLFKHPTSDEMLDLNAPHPLSTLWRALVSKVEEGQ